MPILRTHDMIAAGGITIGEISAVIGPNNIVEVTVVLNNDNYSVTEVSQPESVMAGINDSFVRITGSLRSDRVHRT